ncbi:hypothetical protein FIBSPDRAFT_856617 [Athelia psychrophila]|uniref:Uncharacterized protein n=1 Tax=Athelia psychrophila TaxID=1759441 RepID=A0A166NB17_9AGAM|nr:hypothetical protein FIBSPDRAFT_856617 [Fibularhizoctonia sp. CBS 109695]
MIGAGASRTLSRPAYPKTISTVDFPVSRFGRLASASRTPPVTFQNTHDTHASWQRRIFIPEHPKAILDGAPSC